MKKKDIMMLGVAGVIFLATGYVAINQLGLFGGSSSNTKVVSVEVAPVIKSDFNQDALQTLTDTTKNHDFTVQVNLSSGLGTANPFQPL